MSRKVVPSLFHLWSRGMLPDRLCIVGFGRREWVDDQLRSHVRSILAERAPEGTDAKRIEEFLHLFRYQQGEFHEEGAYAAMNASLKAIDAEWGECSNKLFYLAVPPEHYETIFRNLAGSGLTDPCSEQEGWTRVLVEKPFGDDEASARELDVLLGSLFREEQIYRIDHYLAKEMLQGIMNFRFTNNLFEMEWSRQAIERIDISLNESLGVESRGAFYDGVGALRDVGQNHLLQMLALITMDQPATASSDDVRASRAELIESLRPMTAGEVAENTFRAQYAGYLSVPGVAPNSHTETYFKLRTTMQGERWAGVPVTMESGKRMGAACKEIVVTFRHPANCLCEDDVHRANKVVFTLEPSDRVEIVFYAKKPGFADEIEQRRFTFFLYEKELKQQYVEEYAKLLYDAFRGDQSLFVSTREVNAGWRFIDSVVDGWKTGSVPLEAYAPDSHDIVTRADEALTAHELRGRVGVCGLGKMGAGLALNLIDHGWQVVGWNRHFEVADAMRADGLEPASSLHELVEALHPPRAIWLMVPAGAPVDQLLFGDDVETAETPSERRDLYGDGLAGLLSPGDIVIDGGNSHYTDAAPRAAKLAESGVHYLDCGTSGGPSGARRGACLMIGGDQFDFDRLEPMFADVAVAGGYRFFAGHGAGHFVKMVHNGIEYGMMQAIAEGFEVLHASPFDLDLSDVTSIYQHGSVVESRLVGWLQGAYDDLGDDLEGVSGVVGHSGEGEWTIQAGADLGVATPVIEESLAFRKRSAEHPSYAGRALTAMRNAFGGHGLGPGGGPRR
jgi:glucose-6-phosphate 1-dehydrogenase